MLVLETRIFVINMGKNDQILIQWVTKDKWNGVKQNAKRKDIKPEGGVLCSGQEVKLKWSNRCYNIIVCEDWSPKKRKGIFFIDTKLISLPQGEFHLRQNPFLVFVFFLKSKSEFPNRKHCESILMLIQKFVS